MLYTELVLPGVLPLGLLVERMTAGAALLDLPTPRIAPGEPANLALVDLGASWEVGAHGYASKSTNCCFEGHTLRGVVRLTVAAGAVVAPRQRRRRRGGARVSAGRNPRSSTARAPRSS